MDDATLSRIKDLIERHEGREHNVYNDTAGHPTIGVGFNLDREGAREAIEALGLNYNDVRSGVASLNDAQIDTLFDSDVRQSIESAQQEVSNFDDLTPDRQAVVTDMVFNLGAAGFAEFHNTIDAIENGDWETASEEMLDSVWASQVPDRAQEDADLMAADEES
jgi:GH24 family phage-related lysozyme (muramidase)